MTMTDRHIRPRLPRGLTRTILRPALVAGFLFALALPLGGCPLATLPGLATVAASGYCAGVSAEGKAAIRGALGLPVPLLSCHDLLRSHDGPAGAAGR
ncbi:hypothetical protein [Oceanibaculum indicum]|nr:hypothetical protein [Oceanibaculum indicum]